MGSQPWRLTGGEDAHLQACGAGDGARRWRFDHQHVVRARPIKGDRTGRLWGTKAGVSGERPHHVRGDEPRREGGIRCVKPRFLPGLIHHRRSRAHLDEKMLAGLSKATLTPNVGQPEDLADVVGSWPQRVPATSRDTMIAVDGGMSAHVSGWGDAEQEGERFCYDGTST